MAEEVAPQDRDSAEKPLTSVPETSPSNSFSPEEADTVRTIGRFTLRGQYDDLPQQWWFASTAIPLLAATIGPLANVLSIAALVSTWRVQLPNNGQLPEGTDDAGVAIPDPHWETVMNAISLAFGVVGNLCLLFNFTRRIRYIVALPLTIIAWYFATGILIGLVVAMNEHDPPIRPGQTYSQGYWHAVIAAVLYLIGSMILMVNMLGYFLGHYPQHFELDDYQRTLILQTMMFFIWLAGGGGIFAKVCGWDYANALYFCDVTILTVGFGDFVATDDVGRGILIPYSIFGIIFLGLMIKSIRRFAINMSKDNIIRAHQGKTRERALGRTVSNEKELRDRLGLPPRRESDARRASYFPTLSPAAVNAARKASLEQYGHFDIHGRTITFHEHKAKGPMGRGSNGRTYDRNALARSDTEELQGGSQKAHAKRKRRRERLLLLKEEKDRFDAMRDIQANTRRFKQYYSLSWSVVAFGILWCVGAVVFMCVERRLQNLTYFQSLYFCWVSLLTIGYGDFSPQSNAGKPFFVVWSLVAVPTMTILISDMGETIVMSINRGTFTLAEWTIMPKKGVVHDFVEKHPQINKWLEQKTKDRQAMKRIEEGFRIQDPDEETPVNETADNDPQQRDNSQPTLERLAKEPLVVTEHDLARRLANAIKKTANDLRLPHHKKYSYEEWVEFTRLIRFSRESPEQVEEDEEEEGLVDWDWIGEDSPMLADVSESEWILDRLCESLNRYTKKQARQSRQRNHRPYLRNPDSAVSIDFPVQANGRTQSNPMRYQKGSIPSYPAHPGPRSPSLRQYSSPEMSPGFREDIFKRSDSDIGDKEERKDSRAIPP